MNAGKGQPVFGNSVDELLIGKIADTAKKNAESIPVFEKNKSAQKEPSPIRGCCKKKMPIFVCITAGIAVIGAFLFFLHYARKHRNK
jgi:hypothetical protein